MQSGERIMQGGDYSSAVSATMAAASGANEYGQINFKKYNVAETAEQDSPKRMAGGDSRTRQSRNNPIKLHCKKLVIYFLSLDFHWKTHLKIYRSNSNRRYR